MEGWFAVLLLLYFGPSIIAGIRNHNNLNSLLALNFLLGWTVIGWIAALVWSLANGAPKQQPAQSPQDNHPEAPSIDIDLRRSVEQMRAVITQCHDACSDATAILITAAQADGKVSRDDIRLIVKFCLKHGAAIRSDWPDIIERLNAGVSLNVTGDNACAESFSALHHRPILYLNTLYGTLTAMTVGAKRKNRVAEQFVERLEGMIAERAGQPDPEPNKTKAITIKIEDSLPPEAPSDPAPEPTPAPSAAPSWVEQAKAELAAERKR